MYPYGASYNAYGGYSGYNDFAGRPGYNGGNDGVGEMYEEDAMDESYEDLRNPYIDRLRSPDQASVRSSSRDSSHRSASSHRSVSSHRAAETPYGSYASSYASSENYFPERFDTHPANRGRSNRENPQDRSHRDRGSRLQREPGPLQDFRAMHTLRLNRPRGREGGRDLADVNTREDDYGYMSDEDARSTRSRSRSPAYQQDQERFIARHRNAFHHQRPDRYSDLLMADWRQHCGEHHVRRPSGLREVDNGGDGLGDRMRVNVTDFDATDNLSLRQSVGRYGLYGERRY